MSLEDVSQAYIQEGKTVGITGKNAEYKQPDEQLNYCMQDVVLCYKLVQNKQFELMGIIFEVSQDIGESFFKTCNAGFPTAWIKPKLDSIELVKIDKINEEVQKFINDNMMYDANKKLGVKYLGGHVKHPVMGRYLGVVTYDVSSMYPTMANIYSISPETVNCECCKNNPKAKVPDGVMKAINDYLLDPKSKVRKHEARPWHYWICLNQTGKFAHLMQYYFDKKLEYKKQGLTLKEKAIKIMANSSYGAFGNAYFEYTDPRCAELITAFGQYTIRRLEEFAGADNTLYIDTDSLYLRSENKDIIKFAKDELGVKLEVDKRWKIIFLTNNAKNYMGVTEEGTLEHTTLTGMKSNYPSIINEIAENVICKELLELFITNPGTALDKVLQYVRDGFKHLTQECPSNLVVAKLFEKDLWDHRNNNEPKQIYSEILQDCGNDENLAKSRSMGGEVYKFWIVKAKNRSVSMHIERYQLNMEKYKSYLYNAIKPQLLVYGMNEEELQSLEKELVIK